MISAIVAVGKFEGVHRGHQHIIGRLMEAATRIGTPEAPVDTVVLTFRNNPLSVLNPSACPKPVMSPQQRIDTLTELGVSKIVMLDFDEQLANLTPDEFVKTYLVEMNNAKHVIVGEDFRFGVGASGTPAVLSDLGERYGFTVETVNDVTDVDDNRVSSTRIREALIRGDVARAAALLGRPHRVRGAVVAGDARGRDLGFPTANLGPASGQGGVEGLVPADGVYAGTVEVDGEFYAAAISVGNNPTFTPDADSRIEAFILDFDRSIYGEIIDVRFVERLRGMLKFESIDALIDEMNRDVERTRAIIG